MSGLVVDNFAGAGGTSTGSSMFDAAPTVTATGQHIGIVEAKTTGDRRSDVRAFITKYFGACDHGQSLFDSLHTITSKPRFGLIEVEGSQYEIVDIGLRMLTPRELARAQGFPDSYVFIGSQAEQVAKIGNSVVPCVAEALVRANCCEQLAEVAS